MARPSLSEDQVAAFRAEATHVATELFVRDGYERFSLRSLAKALGCSHATPYRYFDGKEEIFACVRAEGFRRFAQALRDSLDPASAPENQLRALARAYLEFSQNQAAAFTVIFRMGQPGELSYPFVNEAAAEAWQVVLDAVAHAIRRGTLAGNINTVAHTLWAGIHGVATLELAQKLAMGRDGATVLDAMVEALLRAHASPEKESRS